MKTAPLLSCLWLISAGAYASSNSLECVSDDGGAYIVDMYFFPKRIDLNSDDLHLSKMRVTKSGARRYTYANYLEKNIVTLEVTKSTYAEYTVENITTLEVPHSKQVYKCN